MTTRLGYSKTSGLALRLSFLLEALRLQLLPRDLSGAALRLPSSADDRVGLLRAAREVRTAFLDSRAALGLGTVTWPLASDRATLWAARTALGHLQGGTTPRLAVARLGHLCERLAARGRDRRTTGTYYTPSWIADSIARTVVRVVLKQRETKLPDVAGLRVLDPAVGAGAFAVAAVEAIAEAWGEGEEENAIRRAVASECLHGYDRDRLAIEACRLSLWLAVSRPRRPLSLPSGGVSVRDALVDPPGARAYDIVLGNPPWGVKLAEARALALARRAPQALSGHRDAALFFLWLAGEAVREDGAVGLLLPDAVLWQTRTESLRRALLDRLRPVRIALLGDGLFPGATAPACIVCLAGPDIDTRRYELSDLREVLRRELSEAIPRRGWTASTEEPLRAPHHSLVVPPRWLRRLQRRLQSAHPTLADLSDRFVFHDVGINYPRAELGRAILYEGPQQDPCDRALARGRDFGILTGIGHSAWLRHDWRDRVPGDAGVSVREAIYRQHPKLVLRQTGDRPVATLDVHGVWFGRSVIAITGPERESLLWLAAVLNSSTFAALYRAATPEAGRPFAQVKVGKLRAIPVPGGGRKKLARLAGSALEEGDPVRRGALLQLIDEEVARAYGLTDAERRRAAAGR